MIDSGFFDSNPQIKIGGIENQENDEWAAVQEIYDEQRHLEILHQYIKRVEEQEDESFWTKATLEATNMAGETSGKIYASILI